MVEFKHIALIHCKQTRAVYANRKALQNAAKNIEAVVRSGPIQVIDTTDCGGCPGRGIFKKIEDLLENGAEGIVLASCITGGEHFLYPCTNFKNIREEILTRFKGRVISIHTESEHPKNDL